MDKNTIWAIVLSALILFGFMTAQMYFFPPEPTTAVTQEQTKTTAATGTISSQAANVVVPAPIQTVPDAEQEVLAEETYTIKTDLVEVTFTNRGGDIVSYNLLNHLDGKIPVQMADNISAQNRAFSLALGGVTTPIINDLFTVKKIDNYTIGFYKNFAVRNNDGTESVFTLAKQYSFKPNDYMFQLDVIINGEDTANILNFNNTSYTLRTSPQIGPHYDQKNNRYENRTFMSYTKDKKKKQILGTGTTKEYDNNFAWSGVAGKYFAILVVPSQTTIPKAVYSTQFEKADYANAQVLFPRSAITTQKTHDSYHIYVGPRTEATLAKYNKAEDNSWNIAGLRLNESMESSGILSWLEVMLKWMMELCYKLIPNWGVAIIIVTIVIKILFFPLTKKSSMSTLKMQEIQPKMTELQTKYKDQPEKLNTELSKLYQEAGYNPLSGCLPMLIQFPLIFAMYNLFNNYFEFRGAMFIPGWIPDLSIGDSVYTFGFSIPFIGNQLRLLPIIYVISQLLFGKITQTTGGSAQNNASMKMMMYGMPLIFFFMFYSAPAGLLLYWTLSNILSLFQQLAINKVMKAKREEMKLGEPKKVVPPPSKSKKK